MPFLNWLSSVTQAVPGNAATQSLRVRILQDPYYRLQSYEEVAIAASLGFRLDVNRAGVDDWLRLPGFSIHQARTLTELTQAGIHLHSLEDIAAAINLPVQRLQPLEPVLLFCYYDPDSLHQIQRMNPNTATVEMLVRIPGIDLYLARAIVQNRKMGPYRNLIHLQRRLSLSAPLVEKLLHYLTFQ
jgi:DNA uptake protein ComE-like DNA-binding protein